MKQILAILMATVGLNVCGQELSPFSFLKKLELTHASTLIRVSYNEKTSRLYNKRLAELDKNHPLYPSDGCDADMLLIMTTKIDNSDKEYAIIYGTCPEPDFEIYEANNRKKYYGSVSGDELIVPGNGFLYRSGHVNSNFNQTQKFEIQNEKLLEIQQPFYYVGLQTKTLRPLKLYADKGETQVVAELPTGYAIEILLAENAGQYEAYYLAKTPVGLVGWLKIRAGQYESLDVEGIFWNGD